MKFSKLSKKFASKYREDFRKDKLKLKLVFLDKTKTWFDCSGDEPRKINDITEAKNVEFMPPLLRKDPKTKKEIKINIDNSFMFNNKEYRVSGWIGIMEKGSRSQPGLTLFRRGRTIKGDDDENQYKPKTVFGDAGSFAYQRLTGWLHLDDFPANQQKNDFSWDDGLEDKFIEFINNEILYQKNVFDLKKIAKTTKDSKNVLDNKRLFSKEIADDLTESFNSDLNKIQTIVENTKDEKGEQVLKFSVKDNSSNSTSSYGNFVFYLYFVDEENKITKKWLQIKKRKIRNEFNLILDFSLKWFSPFNNELENVKEQIIKFAIYFAYAEILHGNLCESSSEIRNQLNNCFSENVEIDKE